MVSNLTVSQGLVADQDSLSKQEEASESVDFKSPSMLIKDEVSSLEHKIGHFEGIDDE